CRALPPGKILTGPASPRRSACAPGYTPPSYGRLLSKRRSTMWCSFLKLWRSASASSRPQAPPRRSVRVALEQLEDRLTPSSFPAATVGQLIADINAANLAGGSNTITLVGGKSFTLTAVDNTADGPTGLPVIAANDKLTIVGNGDTIARSTAAG